MIRFAAITFALCMLIPATPAVAQDGVPLAPRQADEQKAPMPHSIRQSVANYDFTAMAPAAASQAPAFQPSSVKRERSTTRKVLGAALGATAGFFAGGYLGAAIDGDCGGCDDPGLMGAIIGAPIGAVVGAIAGALWF